MFQTTNQILSIPIYKYSTIDHIVNNKPEFWEYYYQLIK